MLIFRTKSSSAMGLMFILIALFIHKTVAFLIQRSNKRMLRNNWIHNVELFGANFGLQASSEASFFANTADKTLCKIWVRTSCGFNTTVPHATQPVKQFSYCISHDLILYSLVKFFLRFFWSLRQANGATLLERGNYAKKSWKCCGVLCMLNP